jgi:hypothetical protein
MISNTKNCLYTPFKHLDEALQEQVDLLPYSDGHIHVVILHVVP